MAKFATMWVDPPVYTGQVMDVEDNVELGGYVDPRTQIEAFFEAGKRLTAGRREMYDLPDGQYKDEPMDPTRSPNFDMADASMINNAAMERIKSVKAPKSPVVKEAEKPAEKSPPEGEK